MNIARYWSDFQAGLFPECLKPLEVKTEQHRKAILILDIIRVDDFFNDEPQQSRGRPKKERYKFARAFIIQKILSIPTVVMLLERLMVDIFLRRLCGWERNRIPCAATFSNVFKEFAESGLAEKVNDKMMLEHIGDSLIMHVSRDSTDVVVHESCKKEESAPKKETEKTRKRGRPKKGDEKPKAIKTVEKQCTQTLDEIVKELPQKCNYGKKKKHGTSYTWKGYKLHSDVSDEGFILSAILTSASVHDSQVAIPLEKMTFSKVNHCYSLMDKGYDCVTIRGFISSLGQAPYKTRRNGIKPELEPIHEERLKNRSVVERSYSLLKDKYHLDKIKYKGISKVSSYAFFSILVCNAEHILRELCVQ